MRAWTNQTSGFQILDRAMVPTCDNWNTDHFNNVDKAKSVFSPLKIMFKWDLTLLENGKWSIEAHQNYKVQEDIQKT